MFTSVPKKMIVWAVGTIEEGIEMNSAMRILKEMAEKVLRILMMTVEVVMRKLPMTVELEGDCDGRHCSCRSSSS